MAEKRIITEELLKNSFSFWDKLTEGQKQTIKENAQLRTYKAGEAVHEGERECTGVLSLLEGRLRTFLLSDSGKEITLFRLTDGDICMLSASCMIKNISFNVHVSAELDTELILINSSVYSKLAQENPALENFMNNIVSQRFSETMWIFEQLMFMKMDQRLAVFLLEQSSLDDSDTITLTHEQIAAHLGTAREVVSRTLKYLANEGYLSVSRKGITLLDTDSLMELTEQ